MGLSQKKFNYYSFGLLLAFLPGILIAQTNDPGVTTLGNLGGNEIQRATGDVVQTICPELAAAGGFGNNDIDQQNLFRACNALVQTANNISSGNTDPQINPNGLGINQAQLQTTLQAIAPEEIAAIASGLTDTAHDQLANVGSRLEFLRTGVATGNLAGIHWTGDNMFGGAAGDEYSRLGLYINGVYGTGDKDATSAENSFDYDAYGIVAGLDYRFTDNAIAGIALNYSESEVGFDNNSGETDSDGYTATLYASFYNNNYYFDLVLGFGQHDHDGSRVITIPANGTTILTPFNETALSSTEADSFSWSIGAGYTQNAGAISANYYLRLDAIDADIDGYAETGSFLGLTVGKQEVESLQAVLGAKVSKSISQQGGVFIPYIGLDWHFEFEDDARTVSAFYTLDPQATPSLINFQSDEADDSFGLFSIGASFVMARGKQLFFNYDRLVALDDVNANTVTFGVRFEL